MSFSLLLLGTGTILSTIMKITHKKSQKNLILESNRKCVNSLLGCKISGKLLNQSYEISGKLSNQSYEISGKLLNQSYEISGELLNQHNKISGFENQAKMAIIAEK